MFPHEQIRRDKDRSWSFKLIDAIASGQHDDLDDVEETLSELDDPRTVAPLLSLIRNTDLPEKFEKAPAMHFLASKRKKLLDRNLNGGNQATRY